MAPKDGQGFARRINLRNLHEFAPLLARKSKGEASVTGDDEQEPQQSTSTPKSDSRTIDPDVLKAEKLFAGKKFISRVPFTPPMQTGSNTGRRAAKRSPGAMAAPTGAAPPRDRGIQRWQKKLSATDAQRQTGNTTGDVRLTQAGWKVNGRQIDQTTYFRNEVFRQANWHRKNASVEEATVTFAVRILGTDYGLHRLVVSHKPSGEASQGNYTTGIQWGDLMTVTKQTDLTGRTLRLFDPPAGQTAFVLEIV